MIRRSLDSTLTLSQARDELVNLRFALDEKRIAKEQSVYEAPAMQRQRRSITNGRSGTSNSRKELRDKTKTVRRKDRGRTGGLDERKEQKDILAQTLGEFTIKAPADGMVIYAREWNGRKKVVGATINPWESAVATLPDLSVMESITYVNEVDIQKIAVGQKVEIKLDADPSKKLSGTVRQVATSGNSGPMLIRRCSR